MKRRWVALDARMIRHTGVGTYIRTLFPHLPELGEPYEYVTISASGLPAVPPWKAVSVRSAPLGLSSQLLPWELRGAPIALLHIPSFAAPLAWPGRIIVTIHDLIPLVYPETIPSSPRRLAFRAWVRAAAGKAAAVLTVSEHSRADLIRLLPVDPSRITVIPPAAGPEFTPVRREGAVEALRARLDVERYLFCIGRAKPYKNLERLLRAFHRIRTPGTALVLGGLPSLPEPLPRVVDRLGLSTHLRIVGHIPDEELPDYYRGADALILPSLYEGFGLPALEAMACGTPVVASDRAAIPEVVGDAGMLVNPEDEAALAGAMARVLSDRALRDRLRAAGIRRAAGFQPQALAARLAAVYRCVLEQE